jgi:hypothetical protein
MDDLWRIEIEVAAVTTRTDARRPGEVWSAQHRPEFAELEGKNPQG